jgi:hypothetical protein
MSRGVSVARRYAQDNGPVVFGCVKPVAVDVRWNRVTGALVIEAGHDARWCETGEVAEQLMLALASAHRRGRLAETLVAMFAAAQAELAVCDGWYRCGRYLLRRPAWQERGTA